MLILFCFCTHLGEPLTQDFLGMFKSIGQKAVMTVAGDASALLSSVGPDEQLSDALNTSRRESIAYMTIPLKAPYNNSYYSASMCCQQLVCRRFLRLVTKIDKYKGGCVDQWPDEWARKRIAYQLPDMDRSKNFCPTMRFEINKALCRTLSLKLAYIARDVVAFFKHGIYVLFKGDDDDPSNPDEFTMYIHFDLVKNPSLMKRIMTLDEKRPDLDINYELAVVAVIIRCLNTIILRGIPQVSSAYPIEISRYTYDATNITSPLKRTIEWGIKTRGSNLDALIPYISFIQFEGCTTTFIHDAKRMYGICGAQVCCQDSLDTIIRSVSKMAYHHVRLMSDVMTYTGYVVSFTRAGLKIITRSPLHLAGFEEILKNITIAAMNTETDHLTNVNSTVMIGNRPPAGTYIGMQLITDPNANVNMNVSAPVSTSASMSVSVPTTTTLSTTLSTTTSISIPASVTAVLPKPRLSYRETILAQYRELAALPQRKVTVYPMEYPFYNMFMPKKDATQTGLIDIIPYVKPTVNTLESSSSTTGSTTNVTTASISTKDNRDYFFDTRNKNEAVQHHHTVGEDDITTTQANSNSKNAMVQEIIESGERRELLIQFTRNKSDPNTNAFNVLFCC